jgi:signal transduction histidine kinase
MSSQAPKSGTVLPADVWLVDDSPLHAEAARQALEPRCKVAVFGDGPSVLEALGTGAQPQLLIVDWYMPNMSGLEVCQFVRQTRDAGELPILILTVGGETDRLVEALEAGANDFVMKPFREKELQARVMALLRTKALYAKLGEAERQLRIEAEFREGFIGMLAHDLRQPLNTFILANQAMSGAPSVVQARFVDMQRKAADRMVRMVAELLDFARSRPELGMPVELTALDFAELVEELLDEVRVGHPQASFELSVEGSCVGHWDRDRLMQLCSNLVGNALEHGAPGAPIKLSLRREGDAVVLRVANRGEQIPAHAIPALFEPFRRGRGAGKGTGGIGLGLHIVSEIVRAHGGTVEALSEPESTVFVVTLPVGELSEAPAQRSVR